MEERKVGYREIFMKQGGCGLDSLCSGYGPVLESCKNGSELQIVCDVLITSLQLICTILVQT
jgi:hypothetical protein